MMTENRNDPKLPFVGLHAHSVAGSPFDGLGYPQEHMDFAYENGSEALALTDHGNMNGFLWSRGLFFTFNQRLEGGIRKSQGRQKTSEGNPEAIRHVN